MKTNTFILIVSVYSLVLGLPAIFLPDFSLEYFAAHPGVPEEQSLVNFLGAYQLAIGYLGYVVSRSTDKSTRRGWLLSIACLTIFAIVIQQYDLHVRGMKTYSTMYLDEAIWLAIAIGALYFWNKEK
jgi:hypothetical protein